MSPTLHDVARLAGVSFKTVSNVVNNRPIVRESTRERVLAAIAELGYRPNISARNLRSGRSAVIGLAVPELSQAYFAQLADDVIRAAEARGLVVLVEQTGGQRDREIEVLRSPRLALTDGLLFSPLGLRPGDAHLVTVGTPLVVLGERTFPLRVDHITMRSREGARAATAHLVERGCRRIALVGAHDGETATTAGLRLAGYRAALDDAGISFDPTLVAPIEIWHRSSGADAMKRLLDAGLRPDGVFAMNDDLAMGVIRAVQDAGMRVPQDVAVIGFDDVDEARYTVPSLSTVDPGRRQIAETAVEMLLERIEDHGVDSISPRDVAPPFQIIARESTDR